MARLSSNRIDSVSKAIIGLANDLSVASKDPMTASHFNDATLAAAISKESEALSDLEWGAYETGMESIKDFVGSTIATSEAVALMAGADLPKHSLEAAEILIAASADLVGYNRAQVNAQLKDGIPVYSFEGFATGPAGNLSIDSGALSMESFDEKVLDKYLNYSIIYNVLASRQDEFSETFFKPLTITPDEVGYVVTMRMEQVWDGNEHLPNGSVNNKFQKRNLIDALTWPEILETNVTDLIPFLQEGGNVVKGVDPIKNLTHFIKDGDATVRTLRKLGEVEVLTAPLKVNMEHGLIGLSSHPSLIANGLMNEKESLDSRLALDSIYLEVNGKVVRFSTNLLYTAAFYRAVEGQMRDMTLSFDNNSFLVSKNQLAMDGSEVPEFKAIEDAGYDVRLRVRAFGKANAENGYVEIIAAPVEISSILKDGVAISPNDPEFLKVAGALNIGKPDTKVTLIGYDLEARRTNYDLRSRGLMLDSTEYREQFMVPLRSPISIQKPIIDANKEHPDVKSLVNATRIQANNDAVKTVLNHAALMERLVSKYNFVDDASRNSFPGIGRHFIQPCYIKEKLHLPSLINSTTSENRLKDIQGAISTKLNEIIGRVLLVTNYIPVVEQLTGGNIGKVQAIIGTDYRLPQYLNIQGDTRLFGGKIDYKIASTPNIHMRNKIVMSLSRVNSDEGPDPFSYGTFIWTPELMVSTQLSRGAQTYNQHLVHPRYMHVVNIPIIVEIDITGIEEVTGESTVLPIISRTPEEVNKYGNDIPNTTVPAPKSVADEEAQKEANKRQATNGKPATP